jgi:hypothetical protein
MSTHFTGLSLGFPVGDEGLDLCDLYASGVPDDPTRTALILNADALHPDAIYGSIWTATAMSKPIWP